MRFNWSDSNSIDHFVLSPKSSTDLGLLTRQLLTRQGFQNTLHNYGTLDTSDTLHNYGTLDTSRLENTLHNYRLVDIDNQYQFQNTLHNYVTLDVSRLENTLHNYEANHE